MVDIANQDLFVCDYRTWISLDITCLYEEQLQPASGSAWPACQKDGKSGPHCWGREISTQFAQQFVSTVTAPPHVGCVVWSLFTTVYCIIVFTTVCCIIVFTTVYCMIVFTTVYCMIVSTV